VLFWAVADSLVPLSHRGSLHGIRRALLQLPPVKAYAAFAASEWHSIEKPPGKEIEDLLGMGDADVLGVANRATGDFLGHSRG
jgi:hypothetical protein